MITNILEVASFDSCIETHFYSVTNIPAGVLVKLRKVSTIENKVYLKESGRIDQNYRTWIAVKIESDVVSIEL